MKRCSFFIFFALCCLTIHGYGQSAGTTGADRFRSSGNALYWKNRMPLPGYWQQDVYYNITANIDEKTDLIDGSETVTYWNNSPDTLTYVCFHLYQNAFQPASYYDNLQNANKTFPRYGKYEQNGLCNKIDSLTIDGQPVKYEIDNTIMKVWLRQPLKNGESVTFSIKFRTYFDTGSVRRRMKKFIASGYTHYDGAHWYPRISVYDRKFGWTADQHLGHEFYGDYGTYDVALTFANDYIVEATGVLQNQSEVLPDSLRKKLDIKNFADKPMGSPASIIIPRNTLRKTWRYHAENVHDFAFTADPTYRIGEASWNGIKCIAVAQESNAAGWQNAAEYTAKIIKTLSETVGMYAWPKMVVADARDGMEYPMLTLDGGREPNYRYLFSHEIGHNWFYGMVGNNETYRAALDEGFTQFFTAWTMNRIDGPYEVTDSIRSKYVYKYSVKPTNDYKMVHYRYLSDAIRGEEPFPLNTHSDHFDRRGYGMVYSKTAVMLYNLQYVLGDNLFQAAMSHYFEQWKFCHPYFEDFRNSIIRFTHADLNWFFDQWLETTQTIDYGIKSVKKGTKPDEHIITFTRKGMQMPVDFRVTSQTGEIYDFHIPNTGFLKKSDATILPKWTGWGKLNPTYQASVNIPGGIENVEIDTTLRLADINMLNNSLRFPVALSVDAKIPNLPDRAKYELKGRPDIWYNSFDGIKIGAHLEGGYMNYTHMFDATIWANTSLAQGTHNSALTFNEYDNISFRINYSTPVEKLGKNTSINFSLKSLDGLNAYSAGYRKLFNNAGNDFVYINFRSQFRRDSSDLKYLLYPSEWDVAWDRKETKYNNTFTIGYGHSYVYKHGEGKIDAKLRSSTLNSDFDFSAFTFSVRNYNHLGKIDFNTRFFAQYGKGKQIPKESSLFLAGANPEELMEDKYTRAAGFIPRDWVGSYGTETNHFQQGGGLNLRGYAGYLVAEQDRDGAVHTLYKGISGISVNGELEFDRLVRFQPALFRKWLRLDAYLFGDAGAIVYDNAGANRLSDLRADAGIGATISIIKWGHLSGVDPLVIRFDAPLLLNRTPATDPEFVKMRWVIGLSRAF